MAGVGVGGHVWAFAQLHKVCLALCKVCLGPKEPVFKDSGVWPCKMCRSSLHLPVLLPVLFGLCMSIDQNYWGTGQHRGDPEVLQTV